MPKLEPQLQQLTQHQEVISQQTSYHHAVNQFRASEQAYTTQVPDYTQAADYVGQRLVQMAQIMYPENPDAQRQYFNNSLNTIIMQGKSPADIYQMAKVWGYQGAQAQGQPSQGQPSQGQPQGQMTQAQPNQGQGQPQPNLRAVPNNRPNPAQHKSLSAMPGTSGGQPKSLQAQAEAILAELNNMEPDDLTPTKMKEIDRMLKQYA
jgi:hypothetical protein